VLKSAAMLLFISRLVNMKCRVFLLILRLVLRRSELLLLSSNTVDHVRTVSNFPYRNVKSTTEMKIKHILPLIRETSYLMLIPLRSLKCVKLLLHLQFERMIS
jgi:hypothetical protein